MRTQDPKTPEPRPWTWNPGTRTPGHGTQDLRPRNAGPPGLGTHDPGHQVPEVQNPRSGTPGLRNQEPGPRTLGPKILDLSVNTGRKTQVF